MAFPDSFFVVLGMAWLIALIVSYGGYRTGRMTSKRAKQGMGMSLIWILFVVLRLIGDLLVVSLAIVLTVAGLYLLYFHDWNEPAEIN
ncbi:hypothetical protein [Haladaptatus litoreus]|nr:hypothetical protein [Haladaptatus litoreus]